MQILQLARALYQMLKCKLHTCLLFILFHNLCSLVSLYFSRLHEGLAITKGTRYILVGFNSIDEKDPLTKETTNLSLWSSWLNPSWAVIRLKQGLEDALITRSRNVGEGGLNHSRYAVSLFRDLYNSMVSGSVVFHCSLFYHK